MTPTKLRTEPAPSESLLRGMTVVYRLGDKKFRCSEKSWPAYLAEVLERKEKKRV